MDLTEEQKQTVKSWVADGAGLSEIQERLAAEFKLTLTYMDVRFLVDDLDADLQDGDAPDPEPAATPETPSPEDATPSAETDLPVEEPDVMDMGAEEGFVGGSVTVDVDRVMRPGAVVSGSVTFSDGVQANWQIDQMGRLGIVPPKEGYQPPAEDIQEFQMQLQQVLQKQGF